MPASADEQTMSFDFGGPGYEIAPLSPVGQPTDAAPGGGRQWSTDTRNGSVAYDFTLVDLADVPDAGVGTDGVGLRFSNAVTSTAIGHLTSPYLNAFAGEPASDAENRTFTAEYTIASATGAYQDGLALEVSVGHATDRAGGVLVFRHVDDGLEIGAFWVPSDATGAGLSSWRSQRIAGPLDGGLWDPTEPHDIRTVVHFVTDGPDQVEVVVDGERADVVPDWEYYHRLTARPPALPEKAVRNLNLRVAASAPSDDGIGYRTGLGAVPSTAGEGFVFTDVSYGSSTVPWTPVAPAQPPVVDPDAPALPETDPLDASAVTQDDRDVTVTLGADAAADRQVGAYLVDEAGEATFAGWELADGDGTVTWTVADDTPEGTYSLVAYDSTSGLVGWVSQAVAVEAPPEEPPPTEPPPTSPPPTSPPPTSPPPTSPPPTEPPPTEPPPTELPPTSPPPTSPPPTEPPPTGGPTPSPLPQTPPPLPPEPDPDPDGPVPVSSTTTTPGQVLSLFFPPGTFDPYEHVYVTWYSTPVFGGWLSADGEGALSATIRVPADLPPGTHTMQLTGTTSGAVYASTVQVLPADPGTGGTGTGGTGTGGTGTGTGTGRPGTLPVTGTDAVVPLVVLVVLVVVGTGLVLVARRRAASAGPAPTDPAQPGEPPTAGPHDD